MATQVILLERVGSLGEMGDVVSVKPGYARNYLLPQKKALRASKENIAYFEAKKKFFEDENAKQKKEAEKLAKKIEGQTVSLIRQASESGHLFGSVNSRNIAEAIAEETKENVDRSMVNINQSFKTIGLFPVEVQPHAEVLVTVTINIARSQEEAEIQKDTGQALLADRAEDEPQKEEVAADVAVDDAQLEDVLEESALEAVKAEQEEQAAAASDAEEPQKEDDGEKKEDAE